MRRSISTVPLTLKTMAGGHTVPIQFLKDFNSGIFEGKND